MKRVFLSALIDHYAEILRKFFPLLLIPVASYGCPDITGIYHCATGLSQFDHIIKNGIHSYFVNGAEFIADMKEHKINQPEMVMNYSASCQDNLWRLSSTVFDKKVNRIQVSTGVFTVVDSKTLSYKFDATVYSPSGDELNSLSNSEILCTFASE